MSELKPGELTTEYRVMQRVGFWVGATSASCLVAAGGIGAVKDDSDVVVVGLVVAGSVLGVVAGRLVETYGKLRTELKKNGG
jgi:hypothetical protein